MFLMLVNSENEGVWEYHIFMELLAYLKSVDLDIELQSAESFPVENPASMPTTFRLEHSFAIICHATTKRYSVLDCHDWVTPFNVNIETLAHDARCQMILKCQFKYEPYDKAPLTKIKPWTYFETHAQAFQGRVEELRRVERHRTPLVFRGNVGWAQREPILACLQDMGLVNDDFGRFVAYHPYLAEISEYKLLLGLEGMGNICHREIEAFGMGVPILMPRLRNRLYDDLIPDHHYVSVDTCAQSDEPTVVAQKIADRYRQVIDDPGYLGVVAANAMRWYDDNVRFPRSMEMTARRMGLVTGSG